MAVEISPRTRKLLGVLLLPVPGGNFLLNLLAKERLPRSYAQWMVHQAIEAQPERRRAFLRDAISRGLPHLRFKEYMPPASVNAVYREVKESSLSESLKAYLIRKVPSIKEEFRVGARPLHRLAEKKAQLKVHKTYALPHGEHAENLRRMKVVSRKLKLLKAA